MPGELCYGKTQIDWETEEGHQYVRAFWCPECQAAKYDGEDFPTPHFKGTIEGQPMARASDPRYEQDALDAERGLPVRAVNEDGQPLGWCSECCIYGEVYANNQGEWSCVDWGACVERMQAMDRRANVPSERSE